jgi:ADP-heptose:LPS heptosyltransferase
LGSDIRDFADTAAIVAQLDLVICVDTALAHVAGALGKPCWVLLPAFGADWRWLLDRTDSPWYPGVIRIFRQSKLNDWDMLIGDVVDKLKSWSCKTPTADFCA